MRWLGTLLASAVLGALAGGSTPLAAADGIAPIQAEDGCVGRVWHLAGNVEARSGFGARKLREGDFIFVGERIHADARSEAVIQTHDAGLIGARPNAEFVTESYAAEGSGTDHLRLRILTGSLRLVSGWISTVNQPGTEILTPSGTITVRGTDYEPYVLPEDLADATPYEAGTYNKVNRGVTVLTSTAGQLEIKARQAGVARLQRVDRQSGERDRGLLTLLLPTLLERAPDFYVAGRFDSEIDEYSRNATARIKARLQQAQSGAGDSGGCGNLIRARLDRTIDPTAVATDWISRLDSGISGQDPEAVLALFAADAVINASTTNSAGVAVSTAFTREQFADSARTALAGMEAYQQRRQTLHAQLDSTAGRATPRIAVSSRVVEQGKIQGRGFRSESDEAYLLELRDDRWLAVRATTTAR